MNSPFRLQALTFTKPFQAVNQVRKLAGIHMKIEVESRNEKEALAGAAAGADIIMLDNFNARVMIADTCHLYTVYEPYIYGVQCFFVGFFCLYVCYFLSLLKAECTELLSTIVLCRIFSDKRDREKDKSFHMVQ